MRNKIAALLAVIAAGSTALSAWLPTGSAPASTPPKSLITSNSSVGTVIDVTLPGVTIEPITVEGITY
ncbi:MAG: hypothetical protein ABIK62_07885, partial [candidate division WOR-3 bacterium]